MQHVINGFIIEANKSGYYYHRTHSWIQYEKPEKAYVWPESEARKILEAAEKNPKEWELTPAVLHPATYFMPVDGKVMINQPGIRVNEFGNLSIYKGGIIKDGANIFKVSSNIVSVSVSL